MVAPELCLYCRRRPKDRYRGLCGPCYRNGEVRKLYPADERVYVPPNEPSAESLERMIAKQRPTMPPAERDEEPPGEYLKEPERETIGKWFEQWAIPPHEWELTPDTSPAAIAADQRAVIAEAVKELGRGATVGAISERVVLPEWTVTRRMRELGLEV